jgi:hypothetical protein
MARPVLTFAYIVEPEDYQIMACTLLASIRTHFGADVQAVGYCPEHRMAEVHPAVFKAHEMMGAEIRPMKTLGMWDTDYPHGNKIIAAMQQRDTDYSAFIDSDVMFLRLNDPANLCRADHVSCSVAASMRWAGQDVWDTIYGALDMPLPTERVRMMRQTGPEVIPYYSAGLVVFPENGGPQGRFPDVWYDTARTIDRVDALEYRRPYLDQMTLPLAIRRAGLGWNQLPEEQHYILGGKIRGAGLPGDRDIFTVHYRNEWVLRELGLNKVGQRLLADRIGVRYVRRLTPEVQDAPRPEPVRPDLGEED